SKLTSPSVSTVHLHTPVNNPPVDDPAEVEVTDSSHPLYGRRFALLSTRPRPPQYGLSLRGLPRHHGAADSSGSDQSGHGARAPPVDKTYLACHNRAHFLRGAMRGAMPCNPTQLWNRLSPTWQARIRADLTALFQEVIDAQLRADYTPTSGPQGRH